MMIIRLGRFPINHTLFPAERMEEREVLMQVNNQIDAWIDAHREDLISDITRLVAIKSVTGDAAPGLPFGEGPARALDEALALCAEYGFRTKNYDHYVGTAHLNERKTALDILVHLDVVGEGEGWSEDPYKASVKGDTLYGRGTDDDKGPAVAVLYAMRAVKESGIALSCSTRLILGTDEESGSRDLEHFFSVESSAPHTFTPDGAFPVYNTEKGGYKPLFKKTWEPQTSLPRVSSFSGGYRINVLPADAEAVVLGMPPEELQRICSLAAEDCGVTCTYTKTEQGVRIKATGKAAHAAMPEAGNNGLTALIKILNALPLADCPSTLALRQLQEVFPHSDTRGKAAGIAMKDEISGELTLAFSLLEMDENGIAGQFDSRVPLCANEENCKTVLVSRLGAMGFSVKGEMSPPHHTPADSPFIQTLLKCYERQTGNKGACLSMGGGTYVHDIEGGVAFGASMPGFQSNLHSANEHVSVTDLLTACKIFAHVIIEMCKEP
jgi:succinyl-diaminopimelate desuccinylase